jgi:hypothetical protein
MRARRLARLRPVGQALRLGCDVTLSLGETTAVKVACDVYGTVGRINERWRKYERYLPTFACVRDGLAAQLSGLLTSALRRRCLATSAKL